MLLCPSKVPFDKAGCLFNIAHACEIVMGSNAVTALFTSARDRAEARGDPRRRTVKLMQWVSCHRITPKLSSASYDLMRFRATIICRSILRPHNTRRVSFFYPRPRLGALFDGSRNPLLSPGALPPPWRPSHGFRRNLTPRGADGTRWRQCSYRGEHYGWMNRLLQQLEVVTLIAGVL
jgi:hypothetical protein